MCLAELKSMSEAAGATGPLGARHWVLPVGRKLKAFPAKADQHSPFTRGNGPGTGGEGHQFL